MQNSTTKDYQDSTLKRPKRKAYKSHGKSGSMLSDNFRNLYNFAKMNRLNCIATSFSLLLIVLVVILTLKLHVDEESRGYVLSSISQGLAAFFALGFTMTFFVSEKIQRDSGHSEVKKIHLHTLPMFIPLMFFYVVGIVLPLLAMQSKSECFFDICVIIGAACFIFTVPYLLYVKYYVDGIITHPEDFIHSGHSV